MGGDRKAEGDVGPVWSDGQWRIPHFHREPSAVPFSLPSMSPAGVLIRNLNPTSHAATVLKPDDVIIRFDGVDISNDGTVPFRSVMSDGRWAQLFNIYAISAVLQNVNMSVMGYPTLG